MKATMIILSLFAILAQACNNTNTPTSDSLDSTSVAYPDTNKLSSITQKDRVDPTDTIIKEILDELTKKSIEKAMELIREELENAKINSDYSKAKREFSYLKQRIKNESNGVVTEELQKRITDLEVDINVSDIEANKQGTLPNSKDSVKISGNKAEILITNNTIYEMVVFYSGIDSKEAVLTPGQTQSVVIAPGAYAVAARVTAPNIRGYAGAMYFSGGYQYPYSFVISFQ